MTTVRVALGEVSAIQRAEDFHQLFDTLFEHSPWVTEGAWQLWVSGGKVALLSAMHLWSLFVVPLFGASREDQLRLVRAHPSLGDVARIATNESRSEQQAAGLLSNLTPEEHAELLRLNGAYSEKHTFPFILAVKGHDKHSIIAQLRSRVDNSTDTEFTEAIDQIALIGWFRLLAKVDDGRTSASSPSPLTVAPAPPTKAVL